MLCENLIQRIGLDEIQIMVGERYQIRPGGRYFGNEQ
jgi:hypothetical protein